MQEFGGASAQIEETKYLIDGVSEGSTRSRQSSACELVEACSGDDALRMLRAHDVVSPLMASVAAIARQATSDAVMGLCAAALALALSRERQNVEFARRDTVAALVGLLAPSALPNGSSSSSSSSSSSERAVGKICATVRRTDGETMQEIWDRASAGSRCWFVADLSIAALVRLSSGGGAIDDAARGGGAGGDVVVRGAVVRGIDVVRAQLHEPDAVDAISRWLRRGCDLLRRADRYGHAGAASSSSPIPGVAADDDDDDDASPWEWEMGVRRLLQLIAVLENVTVLRSVSSRRGASDGDGHDDIDVERRLLEKVVPLLLELAVVSGAASAAAALRTDPGELGSGSPQEAATREPSAATRCFVATTRVLMNMTNNNHRASGCFCRAGGIRSILVGVLLPQLHLAREARYSWIRPLAFDALILTLGLLTNCVEHSRINRAAVAAERVPKPRCFADIDSAGGGGSGSGDDDAACSALLVKYLVDFLMSCDLWAVATVESQSQSQSQSQSERARQYGATKQSSQPSSQQLSSSSSSSSADDGEGEVRGEDLVAAAYLSLFIGCLVQDGERTTNAAAILEALPDGDVRPIVKILHGFLTFQKQAGVLTQATVKAVATVVKQLHSCGADASGSSEDEEDDIALKLAVGGAGAGADASRRRGVGAGAGGFAAAAEKRLRETAAAPRPPIKRTYKRRRQRAVALDEDEEE